MISRFPRAEWNRDQSVDVYVITDGRDLEPTLDKYAERGPAELKPTVLTLPPLRDLGSPSEPAVRSGGAAKLQEILDRLGEHVHDAA